MQNAPREHSAILLTCIKIPPFFKTSVLSIFEWPLKTGFTVLEIYMDAKVKGIALDKRISSYCMLNKACYYAIDHMAISVLMQNI